VSPPLVVIGAGPAGLAAAGTIARLGARVIVIDERPRAGGRLRDHPHRDDAGRPGLEIVEGLPMVSDTKVNKRLLSEDITAKLRSKSSIA